MALKMLYRGPSSRLETLIEKIQQNKDSSPDIESTNTSPSYSPSLPDMATTPNYEMDNIHHINNNNKITQKTHQHHHSTADEQHSAPLNGKNNNNAFTEPNDDRNEQKPATASAVASLIALANTTASETATKESGMVYSSAVKSNATRPPTEHSTKTKTENGNRLAKYGKINGTTAQLSTNSTNNNNNNNNNNVEGSYHCQFCDKSFPRLGYLKKHEQSHAEHMPFKCDYCARLFKHKRSRDRHTKLHTGDRRYRCPHCEAAFSRSDHLKIHMKTHDNQKPFQCTVCNRGYNTAAALTSHMQNHKKQAALQRNNTLNYSPRSTGSASSGNSLYKRKYSPHIDPHRDTPSSQSILAANAKRIAYNTNNNSVLYCIYCTKNDFESLEQLHAHVQQMHAFVLQESATASPFSGIHPGLHLTCEFCTMKFPSVTSMFHHIRTMHIDRINSPTNYMEHVGHRPIGEFEEFYHRKSNESFAQPAKPAKGSDDAKIDIKADNRISESRDVSAPRNGDVKQEDLPTDLSNKKINTVDKIEAFNESAKENSPESYSSMIRRFEKQSKAAQDHLIAKENADSLRCNQCNLVSPNFEAFREHLRGHLARGELKNFVCFHCGSPFNNQNEYELHVSSHFLITTTEHACNFGCNKQFENSDSLQKHLFETHAQNVWKCGICYELFESKVGIQIHFAVAHANKEKIFRCSACMEAFETETDFKNHVRSQHALMFSLPNLQCPLCRTVCTSDLEMHFHLATHPRQYRCTLCPDSFNVEFLLERHMQMHHSSTEKETLPVPFKIDNLNNNIFDYNNYSNAKKLYPFAASAPNKMFDPLNIQATSSMKLPPPTLYELYDNLGKSFYGDIAANKHFMNLYKSDYASKMFMRSNPLVLLPTNSSELHQTPAIEQREYFDKKTPTIEPTFSCGICERSDFHSESEMQTHQKVAHNIKTGVSLRCAYCNDNFRSRHDLENHMKVAHTGGKHKCLICDDIFPTPDILAEHKLSHSRIGVRGKCAYCSANLTDIQSFKLHMTEHGNVDLPVQCICCRQTLNSNYEIELHAKFHIKSIDINKKKTCGLCLAPLTSGTEIKLCKKCYEKHSSQPGLGSYTKRTTPERDHVQIDPINEHFCNLCKKIFATVTELEGHLIEHSFQGCEERGYKCYICSSIFTLPSGLHQHMLEHGANYRPYDCSLCPNKYFFRAELENHLIDHENGRIDAHRPSSNDGSKLENNNLTQDNDSEPKNGSTNLAIKSEINAEHNDHKPDEDDEEYIEVEQMEFKEQKLDKNEIE